MERNPHNMRNLFAQLGQPNDDTSIAQFIESHSTLAGGVQLHQASFWSPAQAEFLRQAICEDSAWAEVADQLNANLHTAPQARH